jgi:hypothetical protein
MSASSLDGESRSAGGAHTLLPPIVAEVDRLDVGPWPAGLIFLDAELAKITNQNLDTWVPPVRLGLFFIPNPIRGK